MQMVMGIDIGSTSTKLVVMNERKEILAMESAVGGAGTSGPEKVLAASAVKCNRLCKEMDYVIATGYGRIGFEQADKQISEISCHGMGVHFLLPQVRTVVDIGGQDVKALSLSPTGIVQRFMMNDKCAAGTGRFLEVMARVLEAEVWELGDLAAQSDQVVDISNTCAVFAESEVISRLASGVSPANIAAGIHLSVARRVVSLALRIGIQPELALVGGVAQNQGIVSALEKETQMIVQVPDKCQFTGAIGASILALQALASN